eukprot:TRINITY_DN2653_c0_g1_i2.p1 TRINITY_DN2653_c0_g1~~TRINITY_DN2653_c0_g1_i2.p1  ORF type:complete len:189 (-),score=29.46 TRINITY_DN2653_c0_g1_i2:154-720(-)
MTSAWEWYPLPWVLLQLLVTYDPANALAGRNMATTFAQDTTLDGTYAGFFGGTITESSDVAEPVEASTAVAQLDQRVALMEVGRPRTPLAVKALRRKIKSLTRKEEEARQRQQTLERRVQELEASLTSFSGIKSVPLVSSGDTIGPYVGSRVLSFKATQETTRSPSESQSLSAESSGADGGTDPASPV